MKLLTSSVENSPRQYNMDLSTKNVAATLSSLNLRKGLSPVISLNPKLVNQSS